MAVRTGTASEVGASAGSGSASVTVPADATAVVAFWSHFNALGASTLDTLTLGGNAFTVRSEIATKTPNSDTVGCGVATLTNLPGTGTQTLAWAWSDTDARDEGGEIILVWVKDVDTSDLVRDSDTQTAGSGGSGTRSVTLDSGASDLVLAMGQRFSANPGLTAGTIFINDLAFNSETYDVGEYTAGASTTTCATSGTGNYDTIAAISLKNVPGGMTEAGAEIAVDAATESVRTATTNPYSFNHTGRAEASGGIQGVVVVAIHGTSATDHITGITYGGVAMRRLRTAQDTTTEPGRTDIWFLGERLRGLGGTQAVEVTLSSATGDDFEFVAITLTTNDGSEVEVLDTGILEDNQANPSVSLNILGRFAVSIAGLYGGGAAPSSFTPNANCVEVASEDLGAFYAYVLRQTTPGISATTFAIGGTASSDDVAYVAAAFARRQFRRSAAVYQDPALV